MHYSLHTSQTGQLLQPVSMPVYIHATTERP